MLRRIVFAHLWLLLAGCMEQPEKKDPDSKDNKRLSRVSLYERLGKEEGIKKVVDDFVAAVIANDNIRPVHKKHFMEGDVAGLKKKLVDQIGAATGGPQKYTGKNMKDAHKGLGITDVDFDALVASLKKALDDNKVGAREQEELFALLGPMRKDIVEK